MGCLCDWGNQKEAIDHVPKMKRKWFGVSLTDIVDNFLGFTALSRLNDKLVVTEMNDKWEWNWSEGNFEIAPPCYRTVVFFTRTTSI